MARQVDPTGRNPGRHSAAPARGGHAVARPSEAQRSGLLAVLFCNLDRLAVPLGLALAPHRRDRGAGGVRLREYGRRVRRGPVVHGDAPAPTAAPVPSTASWQTATARRRTSSTMRSGCLGVRQRRLPCRPQVHQRRVGQQAPIQQPRTRSSRTPCGGTNRGRASWSCCRGGACPPSKTA